MAHRKKGYRFENDWPLENMRKATEETYVKVVTIPVNVEIEGDHRVLNYDRVKQLLINANKIILQNCICREQRGNCDAPLHVCIGLDERAEYLLGLESGRAQEVGIEEALSALKKSHEAGLVHLTFTRRDNKRLDGVDLICGCCSCCCIVLSGILRYGLAPHLLTSDTTEVTDYDKCTLCGVCVNRCQFGAREIVDDSLVVNHDLCFGCGLCVSTCPTNAITLIKK